MTDGPDSTLSSALDPFKECPECPSSPQPCRPTCAGPSTCPLSSGRRASRRNPDQPARRQPRARRRGAGSWTTPARVTCSS
ncbi:hypothetical protein ACFFX0_00770 [Citricoccus parietis]|uniref:Uncharacterized protein n=1 Tax=Citricoccus parietis TaxID=592307 RepID=A0ABV5FU66_9MICC